MINIFSERTSVNHLMTESLYDSSSQSRVPKMLRPHTILSDGFSECRPTVGIALGSLLGSGQRSIDAHGLSISFVSQIADAAWTRPQTEGLRATQNVAW